MERVLGIGGFFFTAKDPEAMSAWYAEHLGVSAAPTSYGGEPWRQEAGVTVLTPFGEDQGTEPPLGRAGWGLNFRVRDLDAMVAQLRGAGIEVDVDAEAYPIGRFAQLADPEGNGVQLWEPS